VEQAGRVARVTRWRPRLSCAGRGPDSCKWGRGQGYLLDPGDHAGAGTTRPCISTY